MTAIRDYQLVSDSGARGYDLEQSNVNTTVAANELGLESTRLDIEGKKQALKNKADTAALTKDFLSKWGSINDSALKVLQDAVSGTTSSTGNSGLDSILADIKGQVSAFETNYGGMTKTAMEGAMGDIATKRGLAENVATMAKPDYEGVAGKAATDTAAQSELARGAEARQAMSYGVDPTSGKFGTLTKKSYMDEARDKVTAMNRARSAEKTRSIGATTAAAGLINPSESASIASNLMSQKSNLLGLETDTAKAVSSADVARSEAKTSAANAMTNIGQQYGSLGSTLLGLQTAS